MNAFQFLTQTPALAWGFIIAVGLLLFVSAVAPKSAAPKTASGSRGSTAASSGLPIELKRDLGNQFDRVIVIIAEGLGDLIPSAPARFVEGEWAAAGKPTSWLIITTGCKSVGTDTIDVMANDDRDAAKRLHLPKRMEATIPYEALRTAGIPEDQMLLETTSDNTYGQTQEVRRLLKAVAVNFDEDCQLPVTLVTHDLHSKRVIALFEKHGYQVADTWLRKYAPDATQPIWWMRRSRFTHRIGEAVATLRDRLKGWL
jgi:hypothetical protein